MMPEFRYVGGHLTVAGTTVGRNSLCECGKRASILATFKLKLSGGGLTRGKERKPLGALMLCDQCAFEMWMGDSDAWRRNRHASLASFMGIEDALRMAKELGTSHSTGARMPPVKQRWSVILAWMAEQGKVTADEIVREFSTTKTAVTSALWDLEQRGYVRVERKAAAGRCNYYIATKKPAG